MIFVFLKNQGGRLCQLTTIISQTIRVTTSRATLSQITRRTIRAATLSQIARRTVRRTIRVTSTTVTKIPKQTSVWSCTPQSRRICDGSFHFEQYISQLCVTHFIYKYLAGYIVVNGHTSASCEYFNIKR